MRNIEITKKDKLLDENGILKHPGWSRNPVQIYNKENIKAPKHRIKEWDYYLVLTNDFAVCFTVADLAYAAMQSVTFIDFKAPFEITKTNINHVGVMGKLNMPRSSENKDVIYTDAKTSIYFIKEDKKRKIVVYLDDFKDGMPFSCDIILDEPDMDSMVIATPFKNNAKAFYYNQKINCMPAHGIVNCMGKKYEFKRYNSFGTLDWGRGVWTYDNTWFWGSGNAYVNEKPFGFNIGHGFGDTKAATENVIFYDGKANKLDEVGIYCESVDFMKPWFVTSFDDRFQMTFEPIINRSAKIDLKAIISDQNQVFGKMSGTAVLDDGTKLSIKDMTCFIEKVHNRY